VELRPSARTIRPGEAQGDDAAAKIVGDRTSSSWPINLLVEALELLGRDIRFRLSIRAAMTILRRADRGRVLDDVFRPLVEVELNAFANPSSQA
jgi:hypothetical protein